MKSILFIHRSVGRNLIKYGHLYKLFEPFEDKFTFADYDHNTGVLSTAKSHKRLGFVFPGKNTYPSNLAKLFTSPKTTKPILDWISKYDVIVLKSCYPTTKIKSDDELSTLKKNYEQVVEYFAKTNQRLVLLTPPPMRPILTRKAWANRARQLANWMVANDFGEHVKVFDLFDELATKPGQNGANSLRKEYRRPLFFDAHPNSKANKLIAPKFTEFLSEL